MEENKNNYWRCHRKTKTGMRHKNYGMLCQDRVSYMQKGSRQAIALVDGVASTDINIIAGEKITEKLNSFMINYFEQIVINSKESVKIQLLKEIRKIIIELCHEYEMSPETFASTLMSVCVDSDSKMYCYVSLGDGIILKDRNIEAFPVNGTKINQTVLTTSNLAFDYMKVFVGNINDAKEFILISDGVYEHPLDISSLNLYLDQIIKTEEFEAREDDQSLIMLYKEECDEE